MLSLREHLRQAWPEPSPDWLRNYGQGRFSLDAFLASRVVFYPGAGFDGQPVTAFSKSHAAHCFVYVDHGIKREDIEQCLDDTSGDQFRRYNSRFRGYRSLDRVDVSGEVRIPRTMPDGLRPYAFV